MPGQPRSVKTPSQFPHEPSAFAHYSTCHSTQYSKQYPGDGIAKTDSGAGGIKPGVSNEA
jgi:hypothetical protein